MISQPRFASHAEQQAMLGTAAVLDPDKYPRRAALAKARSKQPGNGRPGTLIANQRAERERLVPIVAHMAKTMSVTEIARQLNRSRRYLERIAEDNQFTFVKGTPGKRSVKEVVDDIIEQLADG